MKFHLNKIILWLRDGKLRELEFEKNKVNVITGGSNTGKSAILEIIDYCFLASKSKISEGIINENVLWYGINFHINDKHYVICRSALSEGRATHNYYFSSSGETPPFPKKNSDDKTIKALLENEFSIDRHVQIPFGGKVLKVGSKISLRYFLLFTTISQDVITSSSVFFDKQGEERYREALPRIFDLAVGIDSVENLIKAEKVASLENEIKSIQRKLERTDSKTDDFQKELGELIRRAKEYGLIGANLDFQNSISSLKQALSNFPESPTDEPSSEYNILKNREYRLNRILRNLKNIKPELETYKKVLKEVEDSVRPISFLRSKNAELVKTSIYEEIISSLEEDLSLLKKDIKTRTPIDVNLANLIQDHENQLLEVRKKLSTLPRKAACFVNDRDKYFFMGELSAKLNLYGEKGTSSNRTLEESLANLEHKLSQIQADDVSEKRDMFIKLLEELIQEYIEFAGGVMENYENYHPVFDYKNKALLLRKPLTDFIENVGSSSNHMFLHLFLFLALHEAIQRKETPFVPPFLIIDQPSRPYWGDSKFPKKKLDQGDEEKIKRAFELLNLFVDRVVNELKGQCQLIVFEHVPPSTWDDLSHVHLVEEFRGGNALIPTSFLPDQS